MSIEGVSSLHGYGSFAPRGGASLYLSPRDLVTLAKLVAQGAPIDLRLDPPPPEMIEIAPITMVRLVPLAEGALVVRSSEGGVLEFAAGPDARDILADTLRNLARASEMPIGPVCRHVDLEYFPGDRLLAETSMWVTILLLEDSGA